MPISSSPQSAALLSINNPIRKVLGQSAPSAATLTTLYTVPAGVTARGGVLNIANRSATATTIRVAVRPAGASIADAHYLVYDATIPGGDAIQLDMDMTLAVTDVVSVYATLATVSFTLFGEEYGPILTQSLSGNYVVCTSATRPTITFEGLLIYETDTDRIYVWSGSAWVTPPAGMQVVQTFKNDTFSSASAYPTFVDVTGLSVAITPSNTLHRVRVRATMYVSLSVAALVCINLVRGSTPLAQPAAGSSYTATALANINSSVDEKTVSIDFIDSPASVAAVTYKIQMSVSGGTFYVNRRGDSANITAISTITAEELAN